MKKISMLILTGLLSMPVITLAADQGTPDTAMALETASSQQSEEIKDSTPSQPVATPLAANEAPAIPEASNSVLFKTMADLTQQASAIRGDVTLLQQQNSQLHEQLAKMQYGLYGLAVLMVLGMLLSLLRRNPKARQVAGPVTATAGSGKTIKIEDDTQSEYDFMGSSEGIPAKLDLARAYIAMEDFTAARETLAEILSEGSEEHRLEAKSLLSKINQ